MPNDPDHNIHHYTDHVHRLDDYDSAEHHRLYTGDRCADDGTATSTLILHPGTRFHDHYIERPHHHTHNERPVGYHDHHGTATSHRHNRAGHPVYADNHAITCSDDVAVPATPTRTRHPHTGPV